MRPLSLTLLLLVLAAPACKTTASPETPASVESTMPFKGTIVYLELEGGFYGIAAEDGERYFPINLGVPYRQDGLRVTFDMRLRPDIMTTVMWGTPVEIIEMARR
jgi:hypothetical protein